MFEEVVAMSPMLTRIEARVFRADSVRFEACAAFRAGDDPALCACGWLEDDHDRAATRGVNRVRQFPRRRPTRVPQRRAS
jgi:hypothetical protein